MADLSPLTIDSCSWGKVTNWTLCFCESALWICQCGDESGSKPELIVKSVEDHEPPCGGGVELSQATVQLVSEWRNRHLFELFVYFQLNNWTTVERSVFRGAWGRSLHVHPCEDSSSLYSQFLNCTNYWELKCWFCLVTSKSQTWCKW